MELVMLAGTKGSLQMFSVSLASISPSVNRYRGGGKAGDDGVAVASVEIREGEALLSLRRSLV